MSLVAVDDGHGHSLTLVDTDGYRTCTFGAPPEVQGDRVRNIPRLKCRKDDVFVCAPVKSGTHWIWEIISMLFNNRDETIPHSKVMNMLEAMPQELIDSVPSPRVLNTHVHYKYMPEEAKTLGCKIVYVLRNPKDVAVSLFKHNSGITEYKYDGEWQHFLPLFLEGQTEYGSWFDYVLEWESLMTENTGLPIHLVYYEDLKERNLEEVYRLGAFLGIENKDGLFEAVSEKCQFAHMVNDKKQYLMPDPAFLKEGFSFYRKGEIGDWKNYFTEAQNEMFDRIYAVKMKGSKHQFRYEYSPSYKL